MLLSEPQVLRSSSRCDVLRARVRGGDVPSVVLKHFRDDPVLGLDEWAGLELLGRVSLAVAPGLIAGDVESRLLVLEDLGTGPSLGELFNDTDVRAATSALLAVARLTGLMHARTLGVQADFDFLRHGLSPRPSRVRIDNARYLLDHEDRLSRWVRAAGATEAPGTHEDLEVLARELADPGPFLAFTHGDMAPANTLFTFGGPRLLDFEYCGMRHALYDALMWLLVVPLPDELISRAEVTYRLALAEGCAAAQVESAWARARATVVAARTVNLFQWIPPKTLERDREWAPGFSERAALLRHLARCRAVLELFNPVPSLARTLASLEERLSERWAEAPSFMWPAFR
ncbi:phosphotransferase [Pyxidicoccus fallax]|uniref:Phosphotransferase n=1 Tax=Pyxidicoccus fallax TaxID=394095 RepID=A0A848LAT3_9BACT|nr:phosphotransferase [Pyxidicoccus fallax]NMO16019.1 phosphotransferase [Pyxidicoccus fallax]NPC76968.1 phosphotransferase [Pyxidicoccus fallax]